jgi:hypothetical protein
MTRIGFLVCLVALALAAGAASAAPEKVAANRDWIGVVGDDALKKMAPKNGLVTDAKQFAKLWKAWRKGEKVPEIDFKKEFVAVTLASGPNRPSISATLEEGKLKILARQTLIGGDGFGYSLAAFNRKGVKSVNGKNLPGK